MQLRTFGKITFCAKSITTFALPAIMVLALTARWPVAGFEADIKALSDKIADYNQLLSTVDYPISLKWQDRQKTILTDGAAVRS